MDGRVSGKGLMTAEFRGMHETYEGGMRDEKLEGHGLYRRGDGYALEAVFHDGLIDSAVKYTEPSGFRYEGGWNSNGLEEGRGVAVWPDGSRYDDEWHSGVRHDQGLETCWRDRAMMANGAWVRWRGGAL